MRNVRTGSSLGRAFDVVLTASAVSNLGDGARLAAIPLLAAALTDSPLLVAGTTAAQFLPWLVFAPIGGVIVDRADRRRLILVTQAWRAAVMIGFGLIVAFGGASIPLLYVVAFIITAGEILVDPSVVAIVPTIVDRDDLDRANGRISGLELVTNDLVGVPVGAWLFVVGRAVPFIGDGLTYLVSALLFRRLPPAISTASSLRPEASTDGAGGRLRQTLNEIPVGLRWLAGHPLLRPWTASVAVFNVGAASAFSLLVLLIQETHGGSETAFGLTVALAAVAGVIGSSFAARLAARFGRRSVLLTAAALSSAALLAVASADSLAAAMVSWAIGGLATGVLLAIGRGQVQRHCPNEILGRAAIASRMITRTAFVVGAGVGGVIGSGVGVRASFAAAGIIQFVSLFPMAFALRHDGD